jgi:hypothetical protein
MKLFNLEQALSGKPVVTRDGVAVTELHLFDTPMQSLKLYGVRMDSRTVDHWTREGKAFVDNCTSKSDLFMAPTKREGWINIVNTGHDGDRRVMTEYLIHATKEDADFFWSVMEEQQPKLKRVGCVKVEWSE